MMSPLVTVVCLCYNQADYVKTALTSVLLQTYAAIELIIVDDGSTDNSVSTIQEWLAEYDQQTANKFVQQPLFLPLPQNIGNCKAFNLALQAVKGKYVIDLAADDVLLPHRIVAQVAFFEAQAENIGVIYANATFIDENGKELGYYTPPNTTPPQGNIYEAIVARTFICTPTMMIKKAVLDFLAGYDEHLSYEDYDFWVRSARHYEYAYQNDIQTQKRVLKTSWGTKFYATHHNPHLASSLLIFEKIRQMNRNRIEDRALAQRVRYHLRLCCYTHHFHLVAAHAQLLVSLRELNWQDKFWLWGAKLQLPFNGLYRWYFQWKHRWAR
jgi:glycosyltransferase involved in cell wall biosynthesis